MNLYLKYRPQRIEELDLAGVRKILSDVVAANKVGHAYLLTGPRGSGKTSTARVLARMVNCEKNQKKLGEPCNECAACKSILSNSAMDVIEIDAASNRGIDDIRELKEKIRLAPAHLPKKVYIIDEVHMLTTEAFNALLKTLEEPPSHSLFVLCTTELHKVPETIVSRCSRIQFTKATPEEMQRSFKRVIDGEGATAESEALIYLSKAVDGSFRDGVKILDQVLSNSTNLTLIALTQALSGSLVYKIDDLVSALAKKDVKVALAELNQATKNGMDLTYLLVNLMRALRDKLLDGSIEMGVTKLIFTLDDVARRQATSLDGELLIQVAIVEWCDSALAENNQTPNTNNQTRENKSQSSEISSSEPLKTQDASEVWKNVLLSLGQNNMALDTILSKARPGNIHGDELTIYVEYDFHKQQLMSEKNRAKFEEMISKAVGRVMKVNVEIDVDNTVKGDPPSPIASEGHGDIIDEARAIFSN